MEREFVRLINWVNGWPDALTNAFLAIGLPVDGQRISWSFLQLGFLGLAAAVAFILKHRFTPFFEERIRNSGFGPKRLRAAAVVLRRMFVICLALLLWLAVVTLQALTWDSRSYFLQLAATLVTAWVIISITSRIIRNRSLARLVEFGGWIFVTLGLLGILPEAMTLLDSFGFEMNEFRISLLTVLQGIVVFTVLIWCAIILSALTERQLNQVKDFTPTMRVLISKAARFGLILLAFLVGLYAVGIDFTALTLISGAVGVGLGFGLQKVVSNLVSGIILLLDKSIKPGDVITVGDTFGWITALNARYVSVSMRDGREILIPNEDLITQQVQNWSFNDPYVRIDINFGVSYDSDPHLVKQIAMEAAQSHKRVVQDNEQFPVACHVVAFGESSIDFILRFFISDPAFGLTNVRGDVFLALWDKFKEHEISIPYPHREVIMRDPAPAPKPPRKAAAKDGAA